MYCKYVPCFISMISRVQSATLLSATEFQTEENSTLNASDASSSSTNEDLSHLTEEFLECLKIKRLLSDYIHLALICSPFTLPQKQETKYQSKDLILSYINIIGMCISLLGLALHFVAFLIDPEMKNLPRKNLASLTVSLFFAYLLFVVKWFEFHEAPTCNYPLGISCYYFMMASAFWINAISYDIFKSVRAATTKLRLMSKSAEFKWFILYSAYAWLTPAIPSGIIVTGGKSTFLPEELCPKFVEGRCWFEHRISIILFLVSPVALLMLANIIFFVASAVIIFSNSVKSDNHRNRLKRNLILYLKLAIIMGLGWIAGLVSSTIENEAWLYEYIVTISNCLQGLFIFIAFTKFRKTGAYLKERVKKLFVPLHS